MQRQKYIVPLTVIFICFVNDENTLHVQITYKLHLSICSVKKVSNEILCMIIFEEIIFKLLTLASISLWLICLSTSCFCSSAAVSAAFLWIAAAAAASLAAATRCAAATASFRVANLCCNATSWRALSLASDSACCEISWDLYRRKIIADTW